MVTLKDVQLTRETNTDRVNEFLEERVYHKLGSIPKIRVRAVFGIRYEGDLLGVCVLSNPAARAYDPDKVIEISRFGAVDDRPVNTGSWLIARARKWCALEGYEKIISYAGVAGNPGTIYQAAGFEIRDESKADGEGWTNREGRESWEDYDRRRYEYGLDGAKLIQDDVEDDSMPVDVW